MKKLLGVVAGLSLVLTAGGAAVAADRNLAPIRTVSGASSELQYVGDIGVAPDGTLYGSSAFWGALFAYAPTAGANATWSRRIMGSKTGLSEPAAVAVDPQGRVWTSMNGMSPYSIGLFAAGANGNAAPFKTIGGTNTGLSQVGGIAVGPNGDVYVINQTTDSILVFDSQAGGNAEPKRVISGANTSLSSSGDIEVDSAGTVYVAEPAAAAVLAFAPGATGNVNPVRIISGPATTLATPLALSVDSGRNLYVADSSNLTVAVFGPTASGNVAPVTRLVGANTQLGAVGAIDVGVDRRVYVKDYTGPAIRVYAPLFPFQVAGPVRALAVSGFATSARRTITWAPPLVKLNATAVTGYRIIIKKGTRVVVNRVNAASVRYLSVLRKNLKAGKFKVTVYALNKQGAGPGVVKYFTIR